MRFPDRYQNPEDRGAWSETETDAVDFHGSLQIPRLSIPASIREIAHAGKKKVLRTFLFHHLELTRKEFRVSEVINHMPAFHVVAGIAICTPYCAANDDIHVLNLLFDTNTHDFCHSSRFFLMRSRHSSNWAISSSEKPL